MAVATSTTFAIRPRRTGISNPAPVLVLYLIGIWMMVHWYHGIQLDAVLYAGQALARLHPEQQVSPGLMPPGTAGNGTSTTAPGCGASCPIRSAPRTDRARRRQVSDSPCCALL